MPIFAQSLTQSSRRHDGRLFHVYAFNGLFYRVYDDAENALLIIRLFLDQGLEWEEKLQLLLRMLFVDPEGAVEAAGDDLWELLIDITWEVAKLDIDGSHVSESSGEKCFDWDEDADRIKATLLAVYSARWDELKRDMTFVEVCNLLALAPHETPFRQAVFYRTADEPVPDKHNEDEIRHFRKARAFYALKGGDSKDKMESENQKAHDAFAALARTAG